MTYEEAESYIHSFTRFGSQLGLERMKELLRLLKNPQNSLRFLHVAGTNGKGSVCALSSAILEDAGYRVGKYTSPFVTEFRERYQVNGEMICKEDFIRLVGVLKPAVDLLSQKGSHVTEFEAVTAVGMLFFKEQHCDIVVLEVGLGGRFDATNAIDTPLCAVITSISLDHTKILGDTIEQIAFEKAGIIKENTDVVTYPLQSADALAVFLKRCAETNSRLILPNANAVTIHKSGIDGSSFTYYNEDYTLFLTGTHQIYNAVAVIEAMNVLTKKGLSIPKTAVKSGIARASLPARFETLSQNPFVILDGAHNPEAVAALCCSVNALARSPKVAVVGMMADKDYPRAVKMLANTFDYFLAVPVKSNSRTASPEALVQEISGEKCQAEAMKNYESALQKAVSYAGSGGVIVACGSFYLASDIRKTIQKHDKE